VLCVKHKDDNMVNTVSRTCEFDGCTIQPSFNFPEHKRGRFCCKHQLDGMKNVCSVSCQEAECNRRARYNLPGLRASKCLRHIVVGMIRNPRRRCSECEEWSTHGRTSAVRCEEHQLDKDFNLVERECNGCKLLDILASNNLCACCDPQAHNKRPRLAKQDAVEHLLKIHLSKYPPNLIDRIPDELRVILARERPDFLWRRGHLVVILEVDEDQHSGRLCDCEQIRMFNILQAMGTRTLWLRYNPDQYKCLGKQANPAVRVKTLCKVLQRALEATSEIALALALARSRSRSRLLALARARSPRSPRSLLLALAHL